MKKSNFMNVVQSAQKENEKMKAEQDFELPYKNRNDFLNHTFQDILNVQTKIQIVWKYFVSFLTCKKVFYKSEIEVQLFDQAVEMLKEDTDVVSLLHKLQEIDKLKHIMLSKKQVQLFNYTPRPLVTVSWKDKGEIMVQSGIVHHQVDEQGQIKKEIRHYNKKLFHSHKVFRNVKSMHRLFRSYDHLFKKNQKTTNKIKLRQNKKLMKLIGDDLKLVFETAFLFEDLPGSEVLSDSDHSKNHSPNKIKEKKKELVEEKQDKHNLLAQTYKKKQQVINKANQQGRDEKDNITDEAQGKQEIRIKKPANAQIQK